MIRDREPRQAPADPPEVAVFRELVHARDVRQTIAAQRELRRLGWSVRPIHTRHPRPAASDPPTLTRAARRPRPTRPTGAAALTPKR